MKPALANLRDLCWNSLITVEEYSVNYGFLGQFECYSENVFPVVVTVLYYNAL